MRTLDEPGWYVDALPSNEYVRLIPGSHLETHRGRVELPGANVLYLDLAPDGVRFCGVGHTAPVEDVAMEWTGAGWRTHGKTVGPRSVIVDAQGNVLTVPSTGHPAGSQGYRQVADDGRIVLGDEAYADITRGVWEYTTRGDITVGQSGKGPHGEDAVIALYRGKRYVLAEGQCRFIKFRRAGDQLAVSWVQEDQQRSRVLWLTVAELTTFPEQRFDMPAPVPAPVPVPVPPKETVVPANQLATVQRIRAKYPVPLGAQHPAFLIEVARATGGQLFRKDGGAHVTLPNGVNVSMDILIVPSETGFWWVDILQDAEGAAEPVWAAHPNAGGEFVDVSGMSAPEPPVPPPPIVIAPPVTPPTTTGSIDSVVRSLVATAVAPLKTEIAALRAQVAALEQRPSGGGAGLSLPLSVGIRSARTGKFLCNDGDRPAGQQVHADDRDGVGEWETWTLEPR